VKVDTDIVLLMERSRIVVGEGWTLHTRRGLGAIAERARREDRIAWFTHDLTVPSGRQVLFVSDRDAEKLGPPLYVWVTTGAPDHAV
jgi:hypothetical protein